MDTTTQLRVSAVQELSPHLFTTVRLLQMDMAELSDYINEMAEQNPALKVAPPSRELDETRVISHQSFRHNVRRRATSSDATSAMENVARTENGIDDLYQQLRLLHLDKANEYACMLMVNELSDCGYFSEDLHEFADRWHISVKRAEKCLSIVQTLDPAGVGARDLGQCLMLQLERMGLNDALFESITSKYLSDLANRSYARIARENGTSIARVKECAEVIRGLNPRPCELNRDEPYYVSPDYEIESDDDGKIEILYYDDFYPSLRLDQDFMQSTAQLCGSDKSFAKRMTASAKQIIRSIETRKMTMEKILRIIVREQRGYFIANCELLPLRCDDLASEIGVHESTVYRAISGKYLHCSRGTFPLTHFLQKSCGSLTSEAGARELIRRLCAGGKQMSDREISEYLEKQGVHLARRTIAKYRSQMSITSSYTRYASSDGTHGD